MPNHNHMLKTNMTNLQFIKVIWISSILNHSTKHQQSCSIANKSICCTSWWYISTNSRNEPLISYCKHIYFDILFVWFGWSISNRLFKEQGCKNALNYEIFIIYIENQASCHKTNTSKVTCLAHDNYAIYNHGKVGMVNS